MPLDNYTMFRMREAEERAKTASLANALDYAKGLGAGVAGIPGDTANLINALLHVRPTGYGSDDIGRMMGANTNSGAFLAGNIGMPDMGDVLKAMPLVTSLNKFRKVKDKKEIDAAMAGWDKMNAEREAYTAQSKASYAALVERARRGQDPTFVMDGKGKLVRREYYDESTDRALWQQRAKAIGVPATGSTLDIMARVKAASGPRAIR